MELNLKGANVLVTGGSRGIGRSIALNFAAEGANVAICARQQQAIDETVLALKEQGVKATGRSIDLVDSQQYQQWVKDVAAELGGIDCFVANASALAMQLSEDDWQQAFEVDLMGIVRGINAALPFLKESPKASIVTIASVSGIETGIGKTDIRPYNSIKSAVINYTKSLASEYAKDNIRANTVSPGLVDFVGSIWEKIKKQEPEMYQDRLAKVPLGRMASPQDIASAVLFLASSQASYITGAHLVVDGCLSAKTHF